MDKTIIVTGASRGIGAAIAIALARQGFNVACLSRKGGLPAVDAVEDAVLARCIPIVCDVTDADSVREAYAQAAASGAPLAGLVNNAGIHLEGPSETFALADYEAVFATNATSVFASCQQAYPYLKTAGGLIINIGSFYDKMGVKRNLAYCASKAAVGAITRCLAVEWATKGIRVIDVAPGYIETDLNKETMASGPLRDYLEKRIPGRKPGTADNVAAMVAALFATGAPFLSGETIYIDGAQSIAH